MGKAKKAPGYATGTYDTGGLFGSSTTSASGTSFKPTDEMSQIGTTAWSGLSNSLNNLSSNDYSNDPNFQVYQDNFNRQAQQAYDANVLSNLANRGLMKSSGLQAATNSFNTTMADNLADLQDSYYNRQTNNLANYQNTLNNLYNYMTGVNTGSQNNANNVSSYNLSQVQANNQANAYNNAMYANLASSIAGISTCDIRVKENIKKIGEKNGYNWYEFTYKEGLGLPEGRQEGVIAQEVEKINPDAVIEIDGIKRVNYNKLGLNKEV